MFLGVTAPILAIAALVVVIVAQTHLGGGGFNSPQPPRSDVAGVCSNGMPPGGSGVCPSPTPAGPVVATPTQVPATATPGPRDYTVQSGDNLYRICAGEVPDMDADDCVNEIAVMSDLEDDGAIYVGQTLRLPPQGATTPTQPRRAPTPTPTPTPEPEPEPEPPAPVEAEETEVVEEAEDETAEAADRGPSASLVAIGPPITWPAAGEAVANEEDPAPASGYTVQSGDSLLGICVEHAPDMDEDDCIEFAVLLNDLGGPHEIFEGQVLILP